MSYHRGVHCNHTTIGEIFDMDLWKEYCEATGTSEWCVNEGQATLEEIAYFEPDEWRDFVDPPGPLYDHPKLDPVHDHPRRPTLWDLYPEKIYADPTSFVLDELSHKNLLLFLEGNNEETNVR